ncbi:MAG: DNA repair protein RecN [Methylocystaceae bacterium]
MLRELCIENMVLIDHLRIIPQCGMNVFTGETGSGKSMIIDALALLNGERGRSELIRLGTERLLVEGIFDWPPTADFNELATELGLTADDDAIIVSREIALNGRNITRINGRNYPLSALRTLAPWLLNIHAQDDTHELLSSVHYLTYLDQYDPQLAAQVLQLQRKYEEYHHLDQELAACRQEHQNWLRERDFLEYQCQEIEAAGLKPGEEDELESRRRLMRNAGQMQQVCQESEQLLFHAHNGVAAEEMISQVRRLVMRYTAEPTFAKVLGTLDEILDLLEDLKSQFNLISDELDFVPADLEAVEDRLHQLNRLFKKYGASSSEVLGTGQQLRERLKQMQRWGEQEEQLEQACQQAQNEYLQQAEQVSNLRKQLASGLEAAVQKELGRVAMPNAQFVVRIDRLTEPGSQGLDKVTFLFSDNPGQELRPVHKIASGGELSRLALALKVVLVAQIPAQVFIFDEIDAGMSGYALEQIAARIAALAGERQVLLVTHAPVVAAYADNHFVISKESHENATYTTVKELNQDQIVGQLMQMMGEGHAPASALKYAQELRVAALIARQKIS